MTGLISGCALILEDNVYQMQATMCRQAFYRHKEGDRSV